MSDYVQNDEDRKQREIDLAWAQHGSVYMNVTGLSSLGRYRQLVHKHEERNGICFYCEEPAWLPTEAAMEDVDREAVKDPAQASRRRKALRDKKATREHLIKRSDNGSDDDWNIVMACAYCNHNRQEATVEEHKIAMMARAASVEK